MIKYIFTFILFLLIHKSSAQLDKKTWLIGGDFNMNYSQSSGLIDDNFADKNIGRYNDKTFNISLKPKVGYFILDKLAIGLNFGVGYINYSNQIDTFLGYNSGISNHFRFKSYYQKEKSVYYFVGAFMRYYLLNIDKKFNIPIEIGYDYLKTTSTFYYLGYRESLRKTYETQYVFPVDNSHQIKIESGIEFFLNKVVGIQALIGYRLNFVQKSTDPSDLYFHTAPNNIYFNLGLQIHLNKYY